MEGTALTKDYLGDYFKQSEIFKEMGEILEKYKCKDYQVIAFYYDSPKKVEEGKLRSSIGLYKKNTMKTSPESEELEKYCLQNGFKKHNLPMARSLYSSWEFFNITILLIGINKFNKIIGEKLKDASFKKLFKINEKEIKYFINLYDNVNKIIHFYIPTMNSDKFFIFEKDK